MNLLAIVPGVLNTVLSVVKDKTKDPDTSFVEEKVRKGVSISSKRMLNLVGTPIIIATAITDMVQNGINPMNLILLLLGIIYSAVMAWLTSKNEASKSTEINIEKLVDTVDAKTTENIEKTVIEQLSNVVQGIGLNPEKHK